MSFQVSIIRPSQLEGDYEVEETPKYFNTRKECEDYIKNNPLKNVYHFYRIFKKIDTYIPDS